MRISLLVFIAAAPLHAEPDFRLQPHAAKLSSPVITEASGLAFSATDRTFLWIVNDSGSSNEIHLSDNEGNARGSVHVSGSTYVDWEDIAGFSSGGMPYLLIADTGDNSSNRPSSTLYVVREPAMPADGKNVIGEIPVAWTIPFTFEDGPRDCEAVAVDSAAAKIILISKRTNPPGVYELPLRPGQNPIARKIGSTETRNTGFALPMPFGNQPTGMDISADGTMAAVCTYQGAFLFPRQAEEGWAQAFARKPIPLGPHRLAQAESIAFAADGKSIHLISEGKNSPIARYVTAP